MDKLKSMSRFTILILFYSSILFAQENTDRLRPGVQVSAVFSDNYDHGISPALSLSYRRWMFTVGPRFAYDRIFEKKPSFYALDHQAIIDASFRYHLLSEEKRVRPFVLVGVSYKYIRYAYDQEYKTYEPYHYGPSFDHDFNGRWDNRSHSVTFFGGAGADVRIWKGLSFFAGAAVGTTITKSRMVITNTGNGVVEYSEKTQGNGRIGWIASAGLGYRF